MLPRGKKPGRPPIWTRRQLIDGIRFRVRTGVPWRDVPAEHGPWGRVYDLFRRWQRDGTWQQIFTALQARADAKDLITIVRAHQHAARARKGGPSEGAARGWAGRVPARGGCARTRRAPPARTTPTCVDVASAAPSRTRLTRPATARSAARAAAVRRSSTARTTWRGMPSSAAAIG
ncbi:transposase [Streptomyces niveiscabiei]|uniref:transposase n=1 Tax=Streptomyces niveiscabiei TaxID=164115 RepID=UPI0038F7A138